MNSMLSEHLIVYCGFEVIGTMLCTAFFTTNSSHLICVEARGLTTRGIHNIPFYFSSLWAEFEIFLPFAAPANRALLGNSNARWDKGRIGASHCHLKR